MTRLDALVKSGTVATHLGLYALDGAPAELFWSRMDRQKEAASKWRRMRRYARVLRAAPFAEALWVSGALAQSVAAPQSDWDVFVLARAGRLYTARLFLLGIAFTMGRLRTKRSVVVRDRFCFNHYVTTAGMEIRHRSLFVANALSRMVPLSDDNGLLTRFWDANEWMRAYQPAPDAPLAVRRTLPPSPPTRFIRWVLEWFFDGALGDIVERLVRLWMVRRIEADPATHAAGGRVVADEYELEFHPRSQEVSVLDAYNRTLSRLLGDIPGEADSGLTR
jgi:hypothetical protein